MNVIKPNVTNQTRKVNNQKNTKQESASTNNISELFDPELLNKAVRRWKTVGLVSRTYNPKNRLPCLYTEHVPNNPLCVYEKGKKGKEENIGIINRYPSSSSSSIVYIDETKENENNHQKLSVIEVPNVNISDNNIMNQSSNTSSSSSSLSSNIISNSSENTVKSISSNENKPIKQIDNEYIVEEEEEENNNDKESNIPFNINESEIIPLPSPPPPQQLQNSNNQIDISDSINNENSDNSYILNTYKNLKSVSPFSPYHFKFHSEIVTSDNDDDESSESSNDRKYDNYIIYKHYFEKWFLYYTLQLKMRLGVIFNNNKILKKHLKKWSKYCKKKKQLQSVCESFIYKKETNKLLKYYLQWKNEYRMNIKINKYQNYILKKVYLYKWLKYHNTIKQHNEISKQYSNKQILLNVYKRWKLFYIKSKKLKKLEEYFHSKSNHLLKLSKYFYWKNKYISNHTITYLRKKYLLKIYMYNWKQYIMEISIQQLYKQLIISLYFHYWMNVNKTNKIMNEKYNRIILKHNKIILKQCFNRFYKYSLNHKIIRKKYLKLKQKSEKRISLKYFKQWIKIVKYIKQYKVKYLKIYNNYKHNLLINTFNQWKKYIKEKKIFNQKIYIFYLNNIIKPHFLAWYKSSKEYNKMKGIIYTVTLISKIKYFSEWKYIVKERIENKRLNKMALKWYLQTIFYKYFYLWKQINYENKRSYILLRKADNYRNFKIQFKCFYIWKIVIKYKLEYKVKKVKAINYCNKILLFKAFKMYKENVIKRKIEKYNLLKVLNYYNNHITQKYYNYWKVYFQYRKKKNDYYRNIELKYIKNCYENTLYKLYINMKVKQNQRKLINYFRIKYEKIHIIKVIEKWNKITKMINQQNDKIKVINIYYNQKLLKKSIITWRNNIINHKNELIKYKNKRMKMRVINHFKSLIKRRKNNLLISHKHYINRLLLKYFNKMLMYKKYRKEKYKKYNEKSDVFYRKTHLKTSINKLSLYSINSKLNKEIEKEMDEFYSNKKFKKYISIWKEYIKFENDYKMLIKKSDDYYIHKQLSLCINSLLLNRKNKQVKHFYYFQLVKKMMCNWKKYISIRKEKKKMYDIMDHFYLSHALMRFYNTTHNKNQK